MATSDTLPQLSFRSSSCLMEDTIAAEAISVQDGGRNRVALYSNPFLDGQEEALVIDTSGRLTQLRRADLQLGWEQVAILDTGQEPILATEVVVVVSPRDLSLWAVYIAADQTLRVLTLPRPAVGATGTWTAKAAPAGFADPKQPHHLYVQYWGTVPCISLLDAGDGFYYRIMAARTSRGDVPMGITFSPSGTPTGSVDGFAAGLPRIPTMVPGGHWSPTIYVLDDGTLTRFDGNASRNGVISSAVSKLVGVFESGQPGELGCLYLNPQGDLCASYYVTGEHNELVTITCPNLGLHSASSWVDAIGMLHVYGCDQDNTLKVLHQTGWRDASGFGPGGPVWTQATKDGVSTAVCVAVKTSVVSFDIDPYPDYQPNQLIKAEGAQAADQYSICTQDVTTTRWTTEPVRKRADTATAPDVVTHYVSEVTLTSVSGAPVPGSQVSVSADSLVEIISGGASYLVGPGHSAVLPVNSMGKVCIATSARSLCPPNLQVSAVGAQGGLTIQPAADVHNYLAGNGTLASQAGRFSVAALTDAMADGEPVVNTRDAKAIEYTVNNVQSAFGLAKGKKLTSHLYTGDGPAPAIHGFAVSKDEHGKVSHHEFATAEQSAAHLDALRSRPDYGGIWEDFVDFASDVWEGVRNGVMEVTNVIVNTVTTVFIKIGEKFVELVNFVIDTVQTAVHAAESLFRMVVDAVDKVVDWLKALFDFSDIWATKQALESGMKTITSYGLSTIDYFGRLVDGWFTSKHGEVIALFDGLKAEYGGRRVGDVTTQTPQITDAAGAGIDRATLRENPQANWMMHQISAQAASDPAAFAAAFPADSTLTDTFQQLVTAFETKLAGRMPSDDDLDAVTGNMLDPNNPNAAQSADVVAVLELVEQLALGLLEVLDELAQLTFGLVRTMAEGIDQLLWHTELTLGPLNTLYSWIQTSIGLDPEPMTVGGLMFLAAGFIVTVTAKLINGVDRPPFPHGFPAVPAPPWHADHDPAARVGAGPELSAAMANLQIACGACGIVGGIVEFGADLLPLVKSGEGWPDRLTAGLSLVFTGAMFTAVLNAPPVMGSDWTEQRPHNSEPVPTIWSVAFGWSVGMLACSAGSLAASLATMNTPDPRRAVLKNVGRTVGGPLIVSALNWVLIGILSAAYTQDKISSYSTAQGLVGVLPGAVQFIRLAEDEASFPFRAAAVAGIDLLANEASAAMLIASAAWPGPVIGVQKLAVGQVGMSYDQAVAATGGVQPFDAPLKAWTVASGALPAGLTLDAVSGHIVGTPEANGAFTFTATCTDSYIPPKYSRPSPSIQLAVNPTPVGGLTRVGTQARSMEISTVLDPSVPLAVTVINSAGQPLAGAAVRFSVPDSGASGYWVTDAGSTTLVADAVTDATGVATAGSLVANDTTGVYTLTAVVPGVPDATTTFTITNVASTVTAITPVGGSTPQSAFGFYANHPDPRNIPGADFAEQLIVTVTDAGGRTKPNTVVIFEAPVLDGSRYGYFLRNGTQSTVAVSDANGVANAGIYTANGQDFVQGIVQAYGTFAVTATVPGTSVTCRFDLTVARRHSGPDQNNTVA